MGEGTCYACGKTFPRSQLKRCARCFVARYCSRECQRSAWQEGHKLRCEPHPQMNNPEPEFLSPEWAELEVDKQLSRWIEIWRPVLYAFGMFALDLPNHPENYNATHMMIICISPRHLMPKRALSYEMNWGDVWTYEKCHEMWPTLRFAPVEGFERNRGRLLVALENEGGDLRRVRMLTWQTDGIEEYRKIPKERSKKLASSWAGVLRSALENGDVEESKRLFCPI
ncbi:hypothetical protein BDN72DRAFT_840361 [Pluteus cervinus]|uniref:Uncharacterized protein n=1 Tax=Pluteus cervinus TaxID=181527 RepID=A0ACD3AVT9_9AGAR|nr:hypothetical protein BDN72DRAFT_840361 [Pluteus cervinus]